MTPDIQFLIHCCKTQPSGSDIRRIRTRVSQLDKRQFGLMSTLAHVHGIFPLVYHSIQAHAADLISEPIQVELKQQNMHIAMHNMKMLAELLRIMLLLKKNGIEALAFKGPTLAQLAYGDIALRQYTDLDILIKPQDLLIASQLIIEQGFQPRVSIEYLHNQAFLDVNHDLSFYREVSIELHWRLFEKQLLVQFNSDHLWAEYRTVEIQKQQIKTLKTENLLIYLCIHGSKHAWERLEWIADIDRLISGNKNLNWKTITQQSVALKAEHLILLGLNLSNRLFDTAIPAEILKNSHSSKKVTALRKIIISNIQEKILLGAPSKAYYRKLSYFRMQMQKNTLYKIKYFYQNIIQINSADIEALGFEKHSNSRYLLNRLLRLLREYSNKQ